MSWYIVGEDGKCQAKENDLQIALMVAKGKGCPFITDDIKSPKKQWIKVDDVISCGAYIEDAGGEVKSGGLEVGTMSNSTFDRLVLIGAKRKWKSVPLVITLRIIHKCSGGHPTCDEL